MARGLRCLSISAVAALVTLVLIYPATAQAKGGGSTKPEQTARIISAVEKKYALVTALRARFTQVYRSGAGTTQNSSGRVWLQRPGKMRWAYEPPITDEIISDGTTLWLYQPDLNQVVEKNVEKMPANLATDLLSAVGSIKKDFEAEYAGEDDTGASYVLKLTPRSPTPNIKTLVVSIDKTTSLVVETEVEDQFSNTTTVKLDAIELNKTMPNDLFRFIAPKGTKVVRPAW